MLLTTHGSSGDLNPFLALATGLRSRGHMVRFALSPALAPLAAAAGFPVHHLADHPGGALAMRSALGAGTEITLRLRAAACDRDSR